MSTSSQPISLSKKDFKDFDSTLKINGKSWICTTYDCKCNVGRFSLDEKYFKCNGCNKIYGVN